MTLKTQHQVKAAAVNKHIGRTIKAQRLIIGLSLLQLAKTTGISWQKLNKYETGEIHISAGNLAVIAEIFNTPIQDFFGSHNIPANKDITSEYLLLERIHHLIKKPAHLKIIRLVIKILAGSVS